MANATDRRFDILKQKATQEVQRGQQEAQKGLTRQFSRLGGIGTGAFVKQQRLAQEAGARRLEDAKGNIEFQRLGEAQRQEDIKGQRAFATSERLGSQEFAGEQLGKQQAFATSERLGAQQFGALQADLQRKFATGERVASQDFQRGLFDIEQANTIRKLDLAEKQFGMENTVNFLNAKLQVAEGLKKGLFGFDDLAAIPGLFGKETPNVPTLSAAPAGDGMPSLDVLTKLRDKRSQYGSGGIAAAVGDTQTRALARELGVTDEQLKRAGIVF